MSWYYQPIPIAANQGSGGVTNADLTGASTLTFATAASLRGGASGSGASSLTFTTAGVLDGAAGVTNADMSGVSNLTFTTTGSLQGNGGLSGGSTLTFAPSAALRGATLISGASTLAFNTSGLLNTAALMGGASFPTFTVSGTIEGSGESIGFVSELGGYSRKPKKKRLDDIIEAAFERALAPSQPPTAEAKKQVVRAVRAEIKLDGIQASIAEIRVRVNAYAALLRKKADDDEEEILAMLMMV
jgi:hypothetical protein